LPLSLKDQGDDSRFSNMDHRPVVSYRENHLLPTIRTNRLYNCILMERCGNTEGIPGTIGKINLTVVTKSTATFGNLYVQITDFGGVGSDEAAAGSHFAAHQHVEGAVGQQRVFNRHLQQGTRVRIHRRVPQLVRIHFP